MKSKGVTLTELMVVLALLGLIFVPSAVIFKKALGAWWSGTTQIEIQQDARNAMYLLTKDIKGDMRCSIGAVNKNYSFKEPASYSDVINNLAAEGFNPVCENIYTLTITNIDQQYFDINLMLKKETKDKKEHTYLMATRIYPTVP